MLSLLKISVLWLDWFTLFSGICLLWLFRLAILTNREIQSVVIKFTSCYLSILVPWYRHRWFFISDILDRWKGHLRDRSCNRIVSNLRGAVCKNIPRKSWTTLSIAFLIVSNLCSAAILQFLARANRSRLLITRIGNLRVKFYSVDRLGAVELFNSKHLALVGLVFHFEIIVLCFDWLQQLLQSIHFLLFLSFINQNPLCCSYFGLLHIIAFVDVLLSKVFTLPGFFLFCIGRGITQSQNKLRNNKQIFCM